MATAENTTPPGIPPDLGHLRTKEELELYYRDCRLSMPPGLRIPMASGLSFLAGFTLGAAKGGKSAGLRFRAEHAHKLPTTTTGWFLYHKSKNYQVAYGGVREGFKMGLKICFWSTATFAIEQMFDSYRGTADLLNTVTSCVAVAGAFSCWSTAPLSGRLAGDRGLLLTRPQIVSRCP
jgi:hypothetical protein